jgi:DNA replication protein DnaC
MAAIARRCICQNKRVRRVRWDDLLLEIRATYKSDSIGSEMNVIDRMTEAACLFIDDLGTTKSSGNETDFSLRVLLAIIDGRLENCRPTFITSNLSPEQIEGKFDARIGSRLAAACEAIRLSGRDKRRQE